MQRVDPRSKRGPVCKRADFNNSSDGKTPFNKATIVIGVLYGVPGDKIDEI